jgi:DNA-binding transcriptional MocR family regulator
LIVEDAPYRALRYRGKDVETLHSLAPERTLHMSSFSKLLGPGPRLGYMVGPVPIVKALLKTAEDTYICPNNFAHGVAYEWAKDGRLEAQVERLRALYAPRLAACQAAVARHLPQARATRPDGGFFLSLELGDGLTALAVREASRRYGLEIADGQAFFPAGGGESFLRLPYCALTPLEIEEGVRRLAAAVRDLVPAAALSA